MMDLMFTRARIGEVDLVARSLLELLWPREGAWRDRVIVSDFSGKPFGPDSVSLLAARTPDLHKELLTFIRERELYPEIEDAEAKLPATRLTLREAKAQKFARERL